MFLVFFEVASVLADCLIFFQSGHCLVHNAQVPSQLSVTFCSANLGNCPKASLLSKEASFGVGGGGPRLKEEQPPRQRWAGI